MAEALRVIQDTVERQVVLDLLERLGTQDIVAQEPPATLAIAELLRLADTVATLALVVTAAIQAQVLPVTQDIPVLRQHPDTADIQVSAATVDIPGRAVTLASQV